MLTVSKITPEMKRPAPGHASINASAGIIAHAKFVLLAIQFDKYSSIVVLLILITLA